MPVRRLGRVDWSQHRTALGVLAGLVGAVVAQIAFIDVETFPVDWNLDLHEPVNEFQSWVRDNRRSHWSFTWFFNPVSDAVDWGLTSVGDVFAWLPWYTLPLVAFVLVARRGRYLSAGICAALLLYTGAVGLWEESLETLALMTVSVLLAVMLGVPLGVWSGVSRRADAVVRPLLDAMQTVPSTVYLVPAVLFFGIGEVPGCLATVVFALPPVVRLTALGIREVPPATVEAGRMYGSTRWQLLTKVQLPQAVPSIITGVNQSINLALGIVVIAALIGAGGLGQEVIRHLRQTRSAGEGMVAGMAIVAVAIVLDRVMRSFIERPDRVAGRRDRRPAIAVTAGLVAVIVVGRVFDWTEFPVSWGSDFARPLDDAIVWFRDNFGDVNRSFSDFVVADILIRGRDLLADTLAWPVVVVAAASLGWSVKGWRLAVFCAAALIAIGLVGMWDDAIYTFVQTLVAVAVALAIAVPVGIWAGRRPMVEKAIAPILDAFQTVPSLIYAIPFVMIFTVSPVPGILASVIYAIPPGIRVTALGIRQVPAETVEAATIFGASPSQVLWGVRVPLALPTIMVAVNQVIMLVLSMVVIAGMVGAQALGFRAVEALTRPDTGLGVEVGIAIVATAMILDRVTQALADRVRPSAA